MSLRALTIKSRCKPEDSQDVVSELVLHQKGDRSLRLEQQLLDEHLALFTRSADESLLANV